MIEQLLGQLNFKKSIFEIFYYEIIFKILFDIFLFQL